MWPCIAIIKLSVDLSYTGKTPLCYRVSYRNYPAPDSAPFCCRSQSDLHLINLQCKCACGGITWSHFSVKSLHYFDHTSRWTGVGHNVSSFLNLMKFYFSKCNIRNSKYTYHYQYSLSVSEGIIFQFFCCPHDCDHFFSTPNSAKLNASAYTDWSSSSIFSRVSLYRGGSRTAATSKMERFVIIANGWKPLTIITKHFIIDVAAALDPPLLYRHEEFSPQPC